MSYLPCFFVHADVNNVTNILVQVYWYTICVVFLLECFDSVNLSSAPIDEFKGQRHHNIVNIDIVHVSSCFPVLVWWFRFLDLYHDQAQAERVAREAMPRMLAPPDARIGGTVPKLRIPAGMKWWREPLLSINHSPCLLSVTVFGKTSWSARNVGYGSHGHEFWLSARWCQMYSLDRRRSAWNLNVTGGGSQLTS